MQDMSSLNPKLIAAAVLGVAVVVIAAIVLLRRSRRTGTPRSGYIAALYALIDGRRADALKLLTQAVRNGESDVDAYLQLGTLLREAGQPERALQIHRGLTVRRDLLPRQETAIRISIAEDLASLGRMDQAVAVLDELRHGRKDPDVLLSLHRLHHRAGDHDAAYAALRELSRVSDRITPRNRAAYLTSVACALIEEGRGEEARKYLERARKDDRTAPGAIYLSAALAMERGELREAVRLWVELLKSDISYFAEVAPMLEKTLFESSRFDELEGILSELIELHPSNPLILCDLARFHAKKGDVTRGIDLLEAGRVRAKNDPIIAGTLASLYLQSERPEEAQSVLEETDPGALAAPSWRCRSCGERYPAALGFCRVCCEYGSIHRHEDAQP
jgi:lipopolysaccharide biosynthesis regulator YciM